MESRPFFSLLLMYLRFVADPNVKRMSTNGTGIYFEPNYVEKLYSYELDFVLCHQIMHILCGHIWRPSDREGDNYHFACDIQANAMLYDCGFTDERYPHLGNVYRKIPGENKDPLEMTAEEIYKLLPYNLYLLDERTRNKFLTDNDGIWNQKDRYGDSCEIILDIPDKDGIFNDEADEESDCSCANMACAQDWKVRAAFALKCTEALGTGAYGIGDTPDFIKRMIEKENEPTVDWKKILNNFVQEQTCDYSFSPPDRRFSDTGFFLPDFNEKDFFCKEVLFMADTSGSVESTELATVYSEIAGAIEQFGGKLCGKLGFFDAAVTAPVPFETVDDLMAITPYGGGGTDFRVIFEYILKNYTEEPPSCVVIFTDGYGPYPAESETTGIPVLWIINNDEATPPWGKITRVVKNTAKF